jgi:uncharacterized membrane protein
LIAGVPPMEAAPGLQDHAMNRDTDGPTVRIAGHPIFRILASFPVACLCCALVTDAIYARTADMFWSDSSDWLLAAGAIFGVCAAFAGIAAFIVDRRALGQSPSWPQVIGSPIVLALAILNNFVHSRDAWTSVVPEGLILSALTVLAILITAWLGAGKVFRMPAAFQYTGVRP